MKHHIMEILVFAIAFIIFAGGIVLDYFNVFESLSCNLNWDFISNLIVVELFVITYFLLNKREIDREHNKESDLKQMLHSCYQKCQYYVDISINSSIVDDTQSALKIDYNTFVDTLKEIPFQNEEIIIAFITNGDMNIGYLNDYITIKEKYRQFIQYSYLLKEGFYKDKSKDKNELQVMIEKADLKLEIK